MKIPQRARVVLSGGGSGIGRALALELAKTKRARLLLLDLNTKGAEETAALVRTRDGEAHVLECNVGDLSHWQRAAERMDALFGGVDVLINCAGVAAAGRVGEMPIEDWRWLLDANLHGVIHGCHVFVPKLRAQKSGFVLNVASAAGIASLPLMGAYNVSKAGVIALSETLQGELGPDGISVSVVCPTFLQGTNLLSSLRAPEKETKLTKAFFRHATMTADECARFALKQLEARTVIAIPQQDGRWMWRFKRYAPGLFYRALRNNKAIIGR